MTENNSSNYAGFGIRFLASFIDTLIFSIALSPILAMFFEVKEYTQAEAEYIIKTQGIIGLVDPNQLMVQQLILLILTTFLWIKYSGTPGKRILKIKVVDATTGKPLTVLQSVVRYFAYFVAAFPMFVGFFWIFIDKKNQGWHDKIANTVVIKDNVIMNSVKSQENEDSVITHNSQRGGSKDDDTFTA